MRRRCRGARGDAGPLEVVILLPAASYEHVLTSSKITLGVPLAFVLCLPLVAFVPRILLATIPTTFWMLGWLSMSLEV